MDHANLSEPAKAPIGGIRTALYEEATWNWAENRLLWVLCREPYPLSFEALVDLVGVEEVATRRLLDGLLSRKVARAIPIGPRRKERPHVYTVPAGVRRALYGA